jgi:hypothetical protein
MHNFEREGDWWGVGGLGGARFEYVYVLFWKELKWNEMGCESNMDCTLTLSRCVCLIVYYNPPPCRRMFIHVPPSQSPYNFSNTATGKNLAGPAQESPHRAS